VLKTFGAALCWPPADRCDASGQEPRWVRDLPLAVKTDQAETLTPGDSKATADFVTVYNFYGLIDGSAKVPAGWEFSSEETGRTPAMGGYPLVLPLDVPKGAQPDLDSDKAGRSGGADRWLYRDHPRDDDGAG
jgi:hypothetical protein